MFSSHASSSTIVVVFSCLPSYSSPITSEVYPNAAPEKPTPLAMSLASSKILSKALSSPESSSVYQFSSKITEPVADGGDGKSMPLSAQ